jgi:hypothetical protein
LPLLFSYGTLQREDVRFSRFGRTLSGRADELLAFELIPAASSGTRIVAALASGRTNWVYVSRKTA